MNKNLKNQIKKPSLGGNENDASPTASAQAGGFKDLHSEMVDLTNPETTVFGKGAKLQRTPPPGRAREASVDTGSKADTLPINIAGSGGRGVNEAHTENTPVTERSTTLEWPRSPRSWTEQEGLMSRTRAILSKMKAATKRQTNISNDIKVGLVELEEVFSAIAYGIAKLRKTEVAAEATMLQQNAGTPNAGGSVKRPATSPADRQNQQEKRVRDETPDSALKGVWERQVSKQERRRGNLEAKAAANAGTEGTKFPTETPGPTSIRPDATTQTTPKRSKRTRFRKSRPDALVIRPAEGKSYAEILKEIRSNLNPEDTEADIKAIRQTRTGGVLLEFGPKNKNKDGLCGALKEILGDKAKVLCLEPKVSLEIRDMDCLTDNEEVLRALKREIPEVEEVKVNVFPCSRDQKVAIVEMPEKWATKILRQGKLKIGWLSCRVRRRAVVTRCYRCCGYGHMSKDCKGPDRGKVCYKCLEPGHKAKTCLAKSPCVLCAERQIKNGDSDHVPGSGKCTVYREALQAAINLLR